MIIGGAAWAVDCLLPRSPSAVRLHGAPGDGSVRLSWSRVQPPDGIVGWKYQKRVEGNDYGKKWKALSGDQVVAGLTNGRLYSFRVRAVNVHGKGALSNEVAVVPVSSVEQDSEIGALRQAIVDAGRGIEGGLEPIREGVTALKGIETRAAEISGWLSSIDRKLAGGGGGGGGGGGELLPVHLRVHFENAQLEPESRELSDRGIALTSMQRSLLQTTVNMLGRCAAERSVVRIKPYGFASSAPFRGVSNSDRLNVAVANRRAKAVHDALVTMSSGHMNLRIEAPAAWRSFEEMQSGRNRCVTGSREGRSSFPGRVVVLQLEEWGACTPANDEDVVPPCDA